MSIRVVKAFEADLNASSGIAIDAGGQIVPGGPPLVLGCFKLGTMTAFLTLVSASSGGGCSSLRDPHKVPRSTPKAPKRRGSTGYHSRSSATSTVGCSSDLNQQRLHLQIARLGENNKADWMISEYSIISSANMDDVVTRFRIPVPSRPQPWYDATITNTMQDHSNNTLRGL